MGRFIYSDNFTYKYSFAEEDSNLICLETQFGIGKHSQNENDLWYKINRNEVDDLIKVKDELELKYGDALDKSFREKWFDKYGVEKESCDFETIYKVNKKYKISDEHWKLNLIRKLLPYIKKFFNENKRKRVLYFSDEW